MVAPITPADIPEAKHGAIPDRVMRVWNAEIALAFTGGQAYVLQKDIVAAIVEEMGVERHVVFDNNWLNVEELFENAGWDVVYDKPAYCETYEASFTFTPKG